MFLDKLFGKATPASADDGTASADFLVEVGHAISVLITSPQINHNLAYRHQLWDMATTL